MEKSKELKQFEEISEKVCTYLNAHGLSIEKSRKPIVQYQYIWDLVEQHAKSKGLDTTKYLTWLILRSLAQAEYLSIQVEKCEVSILDFTEEPKPKRLPASQNGKRNWLSVFGTEFQRKIINGGQNAV
jgi:hypothetical protein